MVIFSPSFTFRSYLDMYKVIIFSYLFWFVLTIIFITGTTRISIFCMGYLVACFYFLLFGGDLLLKPIRSILRYWDWLIAYNVFVITMKNILSVSSCCVSAALSTFVASLDVWTVYWMVIRNPFQGHSLLLVQSRLHFKAETASAYPENANAYTL